MCLLNGSERTRCPVAAKIALHSAGGTGGRPGSPSPVGAKSLAMNSTSMRAGASGIRRPGSALQNRQPAALLGRQAFVAGEHRRSKRRADFGLRLWQWAAQHVLEQLLRLGQALPVPLEDA